MTPKDGRAQFLLRFASKADLAELKVYADKWTEGNLAQFLRLSARLVAEAGGPWAKLEKVPVPIAPEKT